MVILLTGDYRRTIVCTIRCMYYQLEINIRTSNLSVILYQIHSKRKEFLQTYINMNVPNYMILKD